MHWQEQEEDVFFVPFFSHMLSWVWVCKTGVKHEPKATYNVLGPSGRFGRGV